MDTCERGFYTLKVSFGIIHPHGAISLSVIDIGTDREVSFKRIKKPRLVNEVKFPYLERKPYLIDIRDEKTSVLLVSVQIDPNDDESLSR